MSTFPFGQKVKPFNFEKGFGRNSIDNGDDGDDGDDEEEEENNKDELRENIDEGESGEGNFTRILDENHNYISNVGQLKEEIIKFKRLLLPFFKSDEKLQLKDKLYQEYYISTLQYYDFLRGYNLKKLRVESVVPASAAVTRQWQQDAAVRQPIMQQARQEHDAAAARQWQQPQQPFGQQQFGQQFEQPQQRASPSTNKTRRSGTKKGVNQNESRKNREKKTIELRKGNKEDVMTLRRKQQLEYQQRLEYQRQLELYQQQQQQKYVELVAMFQEALPNNHNITADNKLKALHTAITERNFYNIDNLFAQAERRLADIKDIIKSIKDKIPKIKQDNDDNKIMASRVEKIIDYITSILTTNGGSPENNKKYTRNKKTVKLQNKQIGGSLDPKSKKLLTEYNQELINILPIYKKNIEIIDTYTNYDKLDTNIIIQKYTHKLFDELLTNQVNFNKQINLIYIKLDEWEKEEAEETRRQDLVKAQAQEQKEMEDALVHEQELARIYALQVEKVQREQPPMIYENDVIKNILGIFVDVNNNIALPETIKRNLDQLTSDTNIDIPSIGHLTESRLSVMTSQFPEVIHAFLYKLKPGFEFAPIPTSVGTDLYDMNHTLKLSTILDIYKKNEYIFTTNDYLNNILNKESTSLTENIKFEMNTSNAILNNINALNKTQITLNNILMNIYLPYIFINFTNIDYNRLFLLNNQILEFIEKLDFSTIDETNLEYLENLYISIIKLNQSINKVTFELILVIRQTIINFLYRNRKIDENTQTKFLFKAYHDHDNDDNEDKIGGGVKSKKITSKNMKGGDCGKNFGIINDTDYYYILKIVEFYLDNIHDFDGDRPKIYWLKDDCDFTEILRGLREKLKSMYPGNLPDSEEQKMMNILNLGPYTEPNYTDKIITNMSSLCPSYSAELSFFPVIYYILEGEGATEADAVADLKAKLNKIAILYPLRRKFIKNDDTTTKIHLYIILPTSKDYTTYINPKLNLNMRDMPTVDLELLLSFYIKGMIMKSDTSGATDAATGETLYTALYQVKNTSVDPDAVVTNTDAEVYAALNDLDLYSVARLVDPVTRGPMRKIAGYNNILILNADLKSNNIAGMLEYFYSNSTAEAEADFDAKLKEATLYGINKLLYFWIDAATVITDYVMGNNLNGFGYDTVGAAASLSVNCVQFNIADGSMAFSLNITDTTVPNISNCVCFLSIKYPEGNNFWSTNNYVDYNDSANPFGSNNPNTTGPAVSVAEIKCYTRLVRVAKFIKFRIRGTFTANKLDGTRLFTDKDLILLIILLLKAWGDEYQRLTCKKLNELFNKLILLLSKDRPLIGNCMLDETPFSTFLKSFNEKIQFGEGVQGFFDIEDEDNILPTRNERGIITNQASKLQTADPDFLFKEINKSCNTLLQILGFATSDNFLLNFDKLIGVFKEETVTGLTLPDDIIPPNDYKLLSILTTSQIDGDSITPFLQKPFDTALTAFILSINDAAQLEKQKVILGIFKQLRLALSYYTIVNLYPQNLATFYAASIKTEINRIVLSVFDEINKTNIKIYSGKLPSSYETMRNIFSGPILATDTCITQVVNLYTLTYNTFTFNIAEYRTIVNKFLKDNVTGIINPHYDELQRKLNEDLVANNDEVKTFYDTQNTIISRESTSRVRKTAVRKGSTPEDTEWQNFTSSTYGKGITGPIMKIDEYTDLNIIFEKTVTLVDDIKQESNLPNKPSRLKAAKKAMIEAGKNANDYLVKLTEQTKRMDLWKASKITLTTFNKGFKILSEQCSAVFGMLTSIGRGIKRKGRKILRKKQFTRKVPEKIPRKIIKPKITPTPIKTRKYKIQKHKKTRKHHRKQNRPHHKKTHKHKTPLERLRAKLQLKSTRKRNKK